jgi:hypothetical protein
MKREWYTIGIHLGYRYEGSPIIVSDGSDEPEDTVTTYQQTARPGHRAPHVWLEPGRSTLDLFGKSFVLVRFDNSVKADGMLAAAAAAGMPIELVDIDSEEARALYENKLVLVRPDGHVAWRADADPVDARRIVDVVRGVESAAGQQVGECVKVQVHA